jgi:hypothetical protein
MNTNPKDAVVPRPSEPLTLAIIEAIAFGVLYLYADSRLNPFEGAGLFGLGVLAVCGVSAVGFFWAIRNMASRAKRASTPPVWNLLAAVLHGAACVAVVWFFWGHV